MKFFHLLNFFFYVFGTAVHEDGHSFHLKLGHLTFFIHFTYFFEQFESFGRLLLSDLMEHSFIDAVETADDAHSIVKRSALFVGTHI